MEKSLLGVVWFISIAYCFLSSELGEETLSCSIREEPFSPLGMASLVLVLVLPLLLGPLPVTIIVMVKAICGKVDRSPLLQHSPSPASCASFDHLMCLLLLTIVFLLTYSVNMVVVELLYDDSQISLLSFVLLKYCFGTL